MSVATKENSSHLIGKRILSPKFGVGVIQSIETIGNNREFFVVASEKLNVKNFIPIDDENEYRYIEQENILDGYISKLEPHKKLIDFESKQERINYFKTQSRIQDLETITFLLCELAAIEDRGTVEDTAMKKLIDTLALEVSIVRNITEDTAQNLISENLGL